MRPDATCSSPEPESPDAPHPMDQTTFSTGSPSLDGPNARYQPQPKSEYGQLIQDAKTRWDGTNVTVTDDGKLARGGWLGANWGGFRSAVSVIFFPVTALCMGVSKFAKWASGSAEEKNKKVVQAYQQMLTQRFGEAGGQVAFGSLPEDVRSGKSRLNFGNVRTIESDAAHFDKVQENTERLAQNRETLKEHFGVVARSVSGQETTSVQLIGRAIPEKAESMLRNAFREAAIEQGVPESSIEGAYQKLSNTAKIEILQKAALPLHQDRVMKEESITPERISNEIKEQMGPFVGEQMKQAGEEIGNYDPSRLSQLPRRFPPALEPGRELVFGKFLKDHGRTLSGRAKGQQFDDAFETYKKMAMASGDGPLLNEVRILQQQKDSLKEPLPMGGDRYLATREGIERPNDFLTALGNLQRWESEHQFEQYQPTPLPFQTSKHPLGGIAAVRDHESSEPKLTYGNLTRTINADLNEQGSQRLALGRNEVSKALTEGTAKLLRNLDAFAGSPEARKAFIDHQELIGTLPGMVISKPGSAMKMLAGSFEVQNKPWWNDIHELEAPPESPSQEQLGYVVDMLEARNKLAPFADDESLPEEARETIKSQIEKLNGGIAKLGGESVIETAQIKRLRDPRPIDRQTASGILDLANQHFLNHMDELGLEEPKAVERVKDQYVRRGNRKVRMAQIESPSEYDPKADEWAKNKMRSLGVVETNVSLLTSMPRQLQDALNEMAKGNKPSSYHSLEFLTMAIEHRAKLNEAINQLGASRGIEELTETERHFQAALGPEKGTLWLESIANGLGLQRGLIDQMFVNLLKDETLSANPLSEQRFEGVSGGFRNRNAGVQKPGVRLSTEQIRGETGSKRKSEGTNDGDLLVIHDPAGNPELPYVSTGITRKQMERFDTAMARTVLKSVFGDLGSSIDKLDDQSAFALGQLLANNRILPAEARALIGRANQPSVSEITREIIPKLPGLLKENRRSVFLQTLKAMVSKDDAPSLQEISRCVDEMIKQPWKAT